MVLGGAGVEAAPCLGGCIPWGCLGPLGSVQEKLHNLTISKGFLIRIYITKGVWLFNYQRINSVTEAAGALQSHPWRLKSLVTPRTWLCVCLLRRTTTGHSRWSPEAKTRG